MRHGRDQLRQNAAFHQHRLIRRRSTFYGVRQQHKRMVFTTHHTQPRSS